MQHSVLAVCNLAQDWKPTPGCAVLYFGRSVKQKKR